MMKKEFPKRKLNIFLVFLACSFMAWFVSKLSETYTDRAEFRLQYTKVPDSLILEAASKDKVEARLRASGFQFLGFNFSEKDIFIDLSEIESRAGRHFVPQQVYRRQIDRQLSASMNVLDIDNDTLYFTFLSKKEKKLPVIPDIDLTLGQNYLIEGNLEIQPDSVLVRGPDREIDTMTRVETEKFRRSGISQSFSQNLRLIRPETLQYTEFSSAEVKLSAQVFRFSEKIIEIPVEVVNLPEGTEIKTFPPAVRVLCKARLERLKSLRASDFRVIADYAELLNDEQQLQVALQETPKGVHTAQLLEKQVEFILKRE